MPSSNQTFDSEVFWQFSLTLYQADGIKDACLTLQNQHQGNVNLMLLLLWLDTQQLSFSVCDWTLIENALHRTDNLISPYRQLRHKSKLYLPKSLYCEILDFELRLEKAQQLDLITQLNQLNVYNNEAPLMGLIYCKKLEADYLIPLFYKDGSQPLSTKK